MSCLPRLIRASERLVVGLLLQAGLAAMRDGLIERQKVFERWFISFLRCQTQMVVESSVRSLPRFGLSLSDASREILPHEQVRVEGEEAAGRFGPRHH